MARRLLTRTVCVGIALLIIIALCLNNPRSWQTFRARLIVSHALSSVPRLPTLSITAHGLGNIPDDSERTQAMVLPVEAGDELQWIPAHFKRSDLFKVVPYVLNDRHSPYTVPSNKGGPVMVFLSYILQNYDVQAQGASSTSDGLADVTLFMRGKQLASYNDAMLSGDASKMLIRLRKQTVFKAGFMNLACAHPTFMSSKDRQTGNNCAQLNFSENLLNPTARALKEAWPSLFPGQHLPRSLTLLPGGQFAASSKAIRRVSKSTWIDLQRWLMATELNDDTIIDVFQALWPFLFTGRSDICPVTRDCYCALYAICFEEAEYESYTQLEAQYEQLEPTYHDILHKHRRVQREGEWRRKKVLPAWLGGASTPVAADPWNTEDGMTIRKQIGELSQSIWRARNTASRRGDELQPLVAN